MKNHAIITHDDFRQLADLYERLAKQERHHFTDFRLKLKQVDLCDSVDLPADAVSLGSTVSVAELDGTEEWIFTLCLPQDADIDNHRISVLSPVGIAILGRRAGDDVTWRAPAGMITMRIAEVLFQPELARAIELSHPATREGSFVMATG